ncbi:hypothetical protein [Larkinella soli]|uniref:hypothetical protein n=1 Tax=Larkinella soli TaxID=1770527 RepID=UPI000FFBE024|nr:hypothetical protein [Larkinella soli]
MENQQKHSRAGASLSSDPNSGSSGGRRIGRSDTGMRASENATYASPDPNTEPGATELMAPNQIAPSDHPDTLVPDGGTDGDDTQPGTGTSVGTP